LSLQDRPGIMTDFGRNIHQGWTWMRGGNISVVRLHSHLVKETHTVDEKDGAWYVISIAAIKAEVHEQTLRHYERLGLISPARKGNSPHSPRLYSDRDIERVIYIRELMRVLGVNLAGVDTILHMKDRMEQMQQDLDRELQRMQEQHQVETRRLKDIIERLQRQ